jgi:hypothetical protein
MCKVFNTVHFPCSCVLCTDLLVTSYSTIVLCLLHNLAETIQPSSGSTLADRSSL